MYLNAHYSKEGIREECGKAATSQWALIKGRSYSRNRQDYRELCVRCHMQYDKGGELSVTAKLTEAQVVEIRQRYRPGKPGGGPGCARREGSTRALAEEFGVSHTTIRKAVAGIKWASVPMDDPEEGITLF
jgi:hypothetical protein